jgi:hypothetical protein
VATVLTMITVGVESKGPVPNEVTTDVSFREGFLAVTNIIFAYRTFIIRCLWTSSAFDEANQTN